MNLELYKSEDGRMRGKLGELAFEINREQAIFLAAYLAQCAFTVECHQVLKIDLDQKQSADGAFEVGRLFPTKTTLGAILKINACKINREKSENKC